MLLPLLKFFLQLQCLPDMKGWQRLVYFAIIGGAFFTLHRQRANPAKYTMAIIATILLAALLCFLICQTLLS